MIESSRGFTLLELLVVIAIIGLLSSVVLASISDVRMKARDSQRLSDIKQIQLALEMFFDEYGYYPDNDDSGSDAGWDDSDLGDGFIIGLTGSNVRGDNPNEIVFMNAVPGDPLDPDGVDNVCSQSHAYHRHSLTDYTIVVTPEQNPLLNLPDCGRCSGYDVCFTP